MSKLTPPPTPVFIPFISILHRLSSILCSPSKTPYFIRSFVSYFHTCPVPLFTFPHSSTSSLFALLPPYFPFLSYYSCSFPLTITHPLILLLTFLTGQASPLILYFSVPSLLPVLHLMSSILNHLLRHQSPFHPLFRCESSSITPHDSTAPFITSSLVPPSFSFFSLVFFSFSRLRFSSSFRSSSCLFSPRGNR